MFWCEKHALPLILACDGRVVDAGLQTCAPQYTVKSGDTLSNIASNNGVSLSALEAAQPLDLGPQPDQPREVHHHPVRRQLWAAAAARHAWLTRPSRPAGPPPPPPPPPQLAAAAAAAATRRAYPCRG